MTPRAELLKYFQVDPMWMTFMVVRSMVTPILLEGLVHLVAETVVNIFELVVHQLLFQFVVEIAVLPYASIIM